MRILAYVIGGAGAGIAAGAILGLLGSAASDVVRAGAAVITAVVGIAVGAVELTGRRVPMIQHDRETPFYWKHTGAIGWALRQGAALGFGARTRLGFWLWYVIPVGALISASPLLGAAGYGLYGFTRTVSVTGILSLQGLRDISGVKIMEFNSDARRHERATRPHRAGHDCRGGWVAEARGCEFRERRLRPLARGARESFVPHWRMRDDPPNLIRCHQARTARRRSRSPGSSRRRPKVSHRDADRR
jgi:hypothetical protein